MVKGIDILRVNIKLKIKHNGESNRNCYSVLGYLMDVILSSKFSNPWTSTPLSVISHETNFELSFSMSVIYGMAIVI